MVYDAPRTHPALALKTVYKYRLPFSTESTIRIPDGARILSAVAYETQSLEWSVSIYALVDPAQPERDYHFMRLGTGIPVPDTDRDYAYLGTVVRPRHEYIEHIFTTGYIGDR
jgi:hypothetical protein